MEVTGEYFSWSDTDKKSLETIWRQKVSTVHFKKKKWSVGNEILCINKELRKEHRRFRDSNNMEDKVASDNFGRCIHGSLVKNLLDALTS